MRKLKDVMRKVSVTLMIVAMVASIIPLSKVFAGSGNAQGAVQGSPGKNVQGKLVDVTYVFKSGTVGKNLPQEVEKLKPNREVAYEGTTARPTDPDKTTVATADGTWNFKGWDKQSV